ncbi:hypothetical protein SNEBB_001508 [Seison nebaliae]|nr:hypothetical protein SNEBB_001508 [Seison nebaliae]
MQKNRIRPTNENVQRRKSRTRKAYDAFVSRLRKAKVGVSSVKSKIVSRISQRHSISPERPSEEVPREISTVREESLLVREELPPVLDRRNHGRLWEFWMEKRERGQTFKQKWSDYVLKRKWKPPPDN